MTPNLLAQSGRTGNWCDASRRLVEDDPAWMEGFRPGQPPAYADERKRKSMGEITQKDGDTESGWLDNPDVNSSLMNQRMYFGTVRTILSWPARSKFFPKDCLLTAPLLGGGETKRRTLTIFPPNHAARCNKDQCTASTWCTNSDFEHCGVEGREQTGSLLFRSRQMQSERQRVIRSDFRAGCHGNRNSSRF